MKFGSATYSGSFLGDIGHAGLAAWLLHSPEAIARTLWHLTDTTFMASRTFFTVLAATGIAAASGVGWWLQSRPHPPQEVSGGPQAQAAVPARAASAPRASGVEVALVKTVRLQDDVQAVGTLRSRQSVVLRPEVAGRVLQLGFTDGARVRKGQMLVQLDDTLQKAEVSQAQAQVSIAQANHRRNQELVAQNFVAQRVLDESAANLKVAEAQLALANARLARMRIVAPFDGTLGIRTVNVGDFVRDGADLVNLEDIGTMVVDFRLPERFQSKIVRNQIADLQLDALPDQRFKARIEAIDPLLDVNGRSVAVRAVLANAGPGKASPLRPGMFARVTVVFSVNEQALVVPEEAIVPQGGRQFVVRVVKAAEGGALTSKRQAVQLGLRRDGQVELVSGVAEGDTVVVAGQQRLQADGTPVKVVTLAQAPASAPVGR